MRYHYYPGCSLEGTAREYDRSTRAVLGALGVELLEIPDWTCCGASAAGAAGALLARVLPARNLALAERQETDGDVLAPCSACYLNLRHAAQAMGTNPREAAAIRAVLAVEELRPQGRVRVRHLLDVLAFDVGADRLAARVRRPLQGMRIAPYYGCQCLRPYADFDDPERPTSMEPLIRALGAEVHRWRSGGACCGASLASTQREAGLSRIAAILDDARGADAVATVCPMCHMNLEAFQGPAGRRLRRDLACRVLYLPQLIGLALGLPQKTRGRRSEPQRSTSKAPAQAAARERIPEGAADRMQGEEDRR